MSGYGRRSRGRTVRHIRPRVPRLRRHDAQHADVHAGVTRALSGRSPAIRDGAIPDHSARRGSAFRRCGVAVSRRRVLVAARCVAVSGHRPDLASAGSRLRPVDSALLCRPLGVIRSDRLSLRADHRRQVGDVPVGFALVLLLRRRALVPGSPAEAHANHPTRCHCRGGAGGCSSIRCLRGHRSLDAGASDACCPDHQCPRGRPGRRTPAWFARRGHRRWIDRRDRGSGNPCGVRRRSGAGCAWGVSRAGIDRRARALADAGVVDRFVLAGICRRRGVRRLSRSPVSIPCAWDHQRARYRWRCDGVATTATGAPGRPSRRPATLHRRQIDHLSRRASGLHHLARNAGGCWRYPGQRWRDDARGDRARLCRISARRIESDRRHHRPGADADRRRPARRRRRRGKAAWRAVDRARRARQRGCGRGPGRRHRDRARRFGGRSSRRRCSTRSSSIGRSSIRRLASIAWSSGRTARPRATSRMRWQPPA